MPIFDSPEVYLHHGNGVLNYSLDNGATWSQRQGVETTAYAVDPTNAQILYRMRSLAALGKEPMQKSTNGGSTFASVGVTLPRNVPQNQRGLVRAASGIFLTTGTPEAGLGDDITTILLQRTADEGQSWSVSSLGANVVPKAFSLQRNPFEPSTVVLIASYDDAGAPKYRLYRSLNLGISFASVLDTGSGGLGLTSNHEMFGLFITKAGTLLVVICRNVQGTPPFDFRVYRSADNGGSWTLVHSDAAQSKSIDALADVQSNFCQLQSTGRIWIGGWWYSEDDGLTWILSDTIVGVNADGNALSAGAIYIARDDVGRIQRSTDGIAFSDISTAGIDGRINQFLITESPSVAVASFVGSIYEFDAPGVVTDHGATVTAEMTTRVIDPAKGLHKVLRAIHFVHEARPGSTLTLRLIPDQTLSYIEYALKLAGAVLSRRLRYLPGSKKLQGNVFQLYIKSANPTARPAIYGWAQFVHTMLRRDYLPPPFADTVTDPTVDAGALTADFFLLDGWDHQL